MDLGLRLPSTQLAFAIVALVLVANLLLHAATGVVVEADSMKAWASSATAVLAVPLLCAGVIYRLRDDRAHGARLTSAFAERVSLAVFAGLLLGLFTSAGAILSYQAASFALPFQDGRLAAIDRAIGVDWIAVATAVCGTPWIESTLAFAYRSSMTQVLALVPLLALMGRRQRLSEFVALFAGTGLVVCVLSALVPAEAAFFHFKPSVICAHVPLDGTLRYHPDLLAIRSGTMPPLALGHLTGIVTFPSFHTILAILVIYAAWPIAILRWPVLVLNLLVIASTLPLGGHYFIDVAAGSLIAVAAIVGVRRLNTIPDALSWPVKPAATPGPLPQAA